MTVLILVMYDKIPFGHMEDTWFFLKDSKTTDGIRRRRAKPPTATMGSTTCETLGARLKTLVGDHGGKGGKRKPGTSGALEETLEVRATTMLNLFFFLDLKILDDDARENPVRTLGVRG